ncbi:MAG: 2-dehydropantoate 2-reductase [Clostridia bacterium]|nr:2-dehydropantoate 2-reductase [Clostridia bacterium]
MRIYVDFDDCLCETGRSFARLAAELFGRDVPYGEMRFFEMDKTFGLNCEQFELLMARGHEPETLLSYEETPGAACTVSEWISCGHQVSVVTGRPFSAYEPSRRWLDAHGLQRAGLYCLDKYGRETSVKSSDFCLTPEDCRRMRFDFAVEDSPRAFGLFSGLPDLRVLVFDRPWNRDCGFPNGNFTRCFGWEDIRRIVAGRA